MPRGILFSGALRIISGPVDCEEVSDMDFQIHCIEAEAYGAVLRAFIAQSEMHVKDGLWNINTAILYPQIPGGQPVVLVPQNRQSPRSGKVRGSVAMQTSMKGVARSGFGGFGNMKPGSDIFEIHATDKLINEVEKICGGANPDPGQIERARLILREHERALMDAIGKLADMSDGDDLPDHRQKQHQYSNEERDRNIQRFRNCAY